MLKPIACPRKLGRQVALEMLLTIACYTTNGIILDVRGTYLKSVEQQVEQFKNRIWELKEEREVRRKQRKERSRNVNDLPPR